MTNYYMLRSFDHAGYYETRLILMFVALGLAYHALRRKQDSRYLVMLISGVFFQGLAEGAIFSVMAFWFLDLKTSGNPSASRTAYLSVLALIVLLSCVVGHLSRGQPITSPRPMFGMTTVIWFLSTAGPAIILAAWRGGLRYLGYFYIGLFIYNVVTFEPLHILGATSMSVRRKPSTMYATGSARSFLRTTGRRC